VLSWRQLRCLRKSKENTKASIINVYRLIGARWGLHLHGMSAETLLAMAPSPTCRGGGDAAHANADGRLPSRQQGEKKGCLSCIESPADCSPHFVDGARVRPTHTSRDDLLDLGEDATLSLSEDRTVEATRSTV